MFLVGVWTDGAFSTDCTHEPLITTLACSMAVHMFHEGEPKQLAAGWWCVNTNSQTDTERTSSSTDQGLVSQKHLKAKMIGKFHLSSPHLIYSSLLAEITLSWWSIFRFSISSLLFIYGAVVCHTLLCSRSGTEMMADVHIHETYRNRQ